MDAECTLLVRTRELLRDSGLSYLDIYTETDLSPNWLSRLATKRMSDPSVNKIQKLYEFLSSRKLTV